MHNLLLCARTLHVHLNYITKMFLLVSKLLLCFVHGQGSQQGKQKHTTFPSINNYMYMVICALYVFILYM